MKPVNAAASMRQMFAAAVWPQAGHSANSLIAPKAFEGCGAVVWFVVGHLNRVSRCCTFVAP